MLCVGAPLSPSAVCGPGAAPHRATVDVGVQARLSPAFRAFFSPCQTGASGSFRCRPRSRISGSDSNSMFNFFIELNFDFYRQKCLQRMR